MALTPFSGELDTNTLKPFDGALDPEPVEPSGFLRRNIADPALSLLKGAVGVPEFVVGVADMATGGQAGKIAEDGFGFKPKEAKETISSWQSPELQSARAKVAEADGFVPTVKALAQNPSAIVDTALESAPSMLGGGGVARGVMKAAPKIAPFVAAAIGEGTVSAGQTAEQVRQESPNGTTSVKQNLIAAGSGALTGMIGLAGGKIAKTLGIGDLDVILAGGKGAAANKNLLRRVAEGAFTEGILEELPQSAQEQVAQNLALNKPWNEGVAKAAASGMIVGGLMGMTANVRPSAATKDETAERILQALAEAGNPATDTTISDELDKIAIEDATKTAEQLAPQVVEQAIQDDALAQALSLGEAPASQELPTPLPTPIENIDPPPQVDPSTGELLEENPVIDWLNSLPFKERNKLIKKATDSPIEAQEYLRRKYEEAVNPVALTSAPDAQAAASAGAPAVESPIQPTSAPDAQAASSNQTPPEETKPAVPRSTAEEIARTMEMMGGGMAEAAHENAVDRFKKEGGLQYFKPETVAMVQQDPRYNVTINQDGSATVNGILDTRTGEWVKLSPVPAPSNPAFLGATSEEKNGKHVITQPKAEPVTDKDVPAMLDAISEAYDNGHAMGDYAPENFGKVDGKVYITDTDSMTPLDSPDVVHGSKEELMAAAKNKLAPTKKTSQRHTPPQKGLYRGAELEHDANGNPQVIAIERPDGVVGFVTPKGDVLATASMGSNGKLSIDIDQNIKAGEAQGYLDAYLDQFKNGLTEDFTPGKGHQNVAAQFGEEVKFSAKGQGDALQQTSNNSATGRVPTRSELSGEAGSVQTGNKADTGTPRSIRSILATAESDTGGAANATGGSTSVTALQSAGGGVQSAVAPFSLRTAAERLGFLNKTVISKRTGKLYAPGTFRESKDRSLRDRLAEIAGIFGHDVTLMANIPGGDFDGGVAAADKRNIYILESVENPHIAVLGHELVHQIEQNNRPLYVELATAFAELKDDAGFAKYMSKYHKVSAVDGKLVVPSDVSEEWVGDVLGLGMTRQSFWDAFYEHGPSLAQRIAQLVKEFLARISGKLNGRIMKSEATIKDFKAVDREASRILKKYAESQKDAGGVDGPGFKRLASEKGTQNEKDKFTASILAGASSEAQGSNLGDAQAELARVVGERVYDGRITSPRARKTVEAKALRAWAKAQGLLNDGSAFETEWRKQTNSEGKRIKGNEHDVIFNGDGTVTKRNHLPGTYHVSYKELFDRVELFNYLFGGDATLTLTGFQDTPDGLLPEFSQKDLGGGVARIEQTEKMLSGAGFEPVGNKTTAYRLPGTDIIITDVFGENTRQVGDVTVPMDYVIFHGDRARSWLKAQEKVELPEFDEAEFDKGFDAAMKFSATEQQPVWLSKLGELFKYRLKGANPEKTLPASHFEMILKDKSLKPDEIEVSGIKDFLKTKERFTTNEVLEELKVNGLDLKDVVLGGGIGEVTPELLYQTAEDMFGQKYDDLSADDRMVINQMAYDRIEQSTDTHFAQYTEPGAKEGSYREMFVTAPGVASDGAKLEIAQRNGKYTITKDGVFYHQLDFDTYEKAERELNYLKRLKDEKKFGVGWQDGHSQYDNIQNPVVRIRFNDREVDGKKVLFIEEMQGPSNANQKKMPEYLRKRIYDLGVKRILTYAKESGYDGVAWTTGDMQAKRYDLSKEVDEIEAAVNSNGTYELVIDFKNYGQQTKHDLSPQELEDNVGKELAKKIIEDGTAWAEAYSAYRDAIRKTDGSVSDAEYDRLRADVDAIPMTYSGLDLKVGGEGLKSLYDKTLPSLFKKYGGEGLSSFELSSEPDAYSVQMAEEYGGDVPESEMVRVSYIPITTATPTSQFKFSATELAEGKNLAKNVTEWFKSFPYLRVIQDATNTAYRWLMPVDRVVNLAASQKDYAPIKNLLLRYISQKAEKSGYTSSAMNDAHHVNQRIDKAFKTEADQKNLQDLVWKATTYELHADPNRHNDWTAKSWVEAGMLEATGKSLGAALKEVRDAYAKLNPEQKSAHAEMLDLVNQMYHDGRKAELAPFELAYGKELVAKADAYKGSVEAAPADIKDVLPLVRQVNDRYPTLKGDYMPLMRFGQYAVRTYAVDENGEMGERTRTEFFENAEDALVYVREINEGSSGLQAKLETRPDVRRDVVNIPGSFLDKLRIAAEKRGFTGEALDALMQDAEGLRANILPRTSVVGNKLRREGVEGYNQNVTRVFAAYVRNHASANARLIHGTKIEQTFRDIGNEIDAYSSNRSHDPNAAKNMHLLKDQLYELERSGNNEKINKFTKAVGKMTFVWYLASPSVWAVQWSQPFMTTIPKMAARFGFGTSFGAYTSAAKEYMQGKYSDEKIDEFDRKHEYVGLRVANLIAESREANTARKKAIDQEIKGIYESFNDSERKLLVLKVLSHQGMIDLSSAHSLQDLIAGATDGGKLVNKAVEKAAFFMQKSETGSRRAAAVSAFDLAFKDGKGFTAANDYTTDVIRDTLADFSSQNRAAWMRGNAGRILGQFQFFRLHMMGKLIQLSKDAVGGEYQREIDEADGDQAVINEAKKKRSEARKELSYMIGSSFALAGAGGTPVALALSNTATSALWSALAFMFGDDDDPWDPKRDFEVMVRESMGDVAGGVVLKGLPSLVGADISRRIGMGGMANIISGDPPAGLTGTAKANWYAGRILGPAWGVASDGLRTFDAIKEGDLSTVLSAGSPKVIKDFVKALGVSAKGIQAGGKTILQADDVSPYSIALMLSGINPLDVSLAQEESRYVKNLSTEMSQRRSKLIRDVARANVDGEDTGDALAAVSKWTATHPKLGITAQELASGIKKERKSRLGLLTERERLVKEGA